MNLAEEPVAVVVFHHPQCGHCQEFLPRARHIFERYAGCLPIAVLDVSNPLYAQTANRLDVDSTPTTVVTRNGSPWKKLEGAVSDEELEKTLAKAARGCEL